jgi:S-DNA-T family DNA segregation ATPase FtsK/SpoIIIE
MATSWTDYVVPTPHRRLNEFIGLILLTLAVLIGLSLVSFNPNDPSFNISRNPHFEAKPANFVGVTGAYAADAMFQMLGYSSVFLPIYLGVYSFYWLASWPVKNFWTRLTGMVLLTLTVSAVLSLVTVIPRVHGHIPAGGFVGKVLSDKLETAMNPAGATIILIATFFVSLFLATTFSFAWAVGKLQPRFAFISNWTQRWKNWKEEQSREAARRKAEEKKAPKQQVISTPREVSKRVAEPQPVPTPKAATASKAAAPAPVPISNRVETTKSAEPPAAAGTPTAFPPTGLLNAPGAAGIINEEELRQRASMLEQKTREFEVDGVVQHIHPGPVVTTFEFKPEPGIKYSRITGLGDDLCLALEAESVRIDRIPGKSTVGIEVPNDQRATITLREMLESPEYSQGNFKLPLALGKDIRGKIVVSDLARMPHLLAAGSTGTGKSVSINAMVLSLLFRCRPDQVKMIMIDPKRLELGLYQDIPHLLVPVVTEPKIAQNALRWAVMEMETRYKKLAKRGVRGLDAYNEQVKQPPIPGLSGQDEEDREPLPYIVIVIDELADLMMTAAREVEESITRLAQMARAVGIHLILATQRPSVDVITGLIKANFPARISFRVASKVDSRTILDSNGAEQLLGRGDMLFLPPGSSRLMRVHGPLVTEDEVVKVAEFLKKQGAPSYNQKILESPEDRSEGGEFGESEVDELYDDAVRVVQEMGKASTSALQRRLRVGYGRAAALLDAMERNGIVGPPDGSRPREVLVGRSEDFVEPE